eukprot:TRINITY_DN7551_c0_g1_i2.p1 TRINITY_DN7551_c0_g1~~TRINITY_DN7551_c0_g1_i2.p1  ORF type:complete len:279 (+),score=37.26 TRINITY_DN7551_c0_g1_i2:1309-2145(+)
MFMFIPFFCFAFCVCAGLVCHVSVFPSGLFSLLLSVYRYLFTDNAARWVEREVTRSGSMYQIQHWHTKYISRAYPSPLRVTSTNFDPMLAWASGVQMVALNYQTADHPMLLNLALFSDRTCGYRLKSRRARGEPAMLRGMTMISKIKVHVVSGMRLPRAASTNARRLNKVSSPYVVVSLTTTEGKQERKSAVVRRNGFDPHFDLKAEFDIPSKADPELCILAFDVYDSSYKEPMAKAAFLTQVIRPGTRCVPLRQPSGALRLARAALMVTIDIEKNEY